MITFPAVHNSQLALSVYTVPSFSLVFVLAYVYLPQTALCHPAFLQAFVFLLCASCGLCFWTLAFSVKQTNQNKKAVFFAFIPNLGS